MKTQPADAAPCDSVQTFIETGRPALTPEIASSIIERTLATLAQLVDAAFVKLKSSVRVREVALHHPASLRHSRREPHIVTTITKRCPGAYRKDAGALGVV